MKHVRILIAVSALVGLTQFSSQESNIAGREKPTVNFYGTITDNAGEKYKVCDITISGMYRQIAVYKAPKNKTDNPADHTTLLDLSEVASIEVPSGSGTQEFNGRQYISIKVLQKGAKKSRNYIIEETKKLECDEISAAGPMEKKISFKALAKVVIEGHKAQEQPVSGSTKSPIPTTKTQPKISTAS